jgi:hypothetical protein
VSGTSGATVTYAGTGTCVIDADQAGGSGFAAAPQVQQSITVSFPAGDADISTALSCPATLVAGTARPCTQTVANAGPATATRITATIRIPFQLAVSCTFPCIRSGSTITQALPSLARGTSARITLTVGAAFVGRATLAITAGAREPDPSPANNTARQTITITTHRTHP